MATYVREGNDLQARGLYLDEPAWQAQVFSVTKVKSDDYRGRLKPETMCHSEVSGLRFRVSKECRVVGEDGRF
jgi:hypothetical protein